MVCSELGKDSGDALKTIIYTLLNYLEGEELLAHQFTKKPKTNEKVSIQTNQKINLVLRWNLLRLLEPYLSPFQQIMLRNAQWESCFQLNLGELMFLDSILFYIFKDHPSQSFESHS